MCVLVVHANGDRIWEDAAEYRRNPAAGSYVLHEQKRSGYKPPPIERDEPARESGIGIRFVTKATRQDALDWIKAGWCADALASRREPGPIQ